jgi:hypothetical protein
VIVSVAPRANTWLTKRENNTGVKNTLDMMPEIIQTMTSSVNTPTGGR